MWRLLDLRRSRSGRTWSQATEFYYHGRPRVLRVWDETLLPGQPHYLDTWSLLKLAVELQQAYQHKLAEYVRALAEKLSGMEDGAVVPIDDLETAFGLTLNDFLSTLSEAALDRVRDIAEALWAMSGNVVRVRQDGPGHNTMLDFTETLPDDIKPMLILDASGRVRETYKQQAHHRGDVVFLRNAPKSYANVTFNVMTAGGGKRAFGKDYEAHIARIVDIINHTPLREGADLMNDPDAAQPRTLVVHHLPSKQYKIGNVEKDVLAALNPWREKYVRFTTWGRHDATNAYADCDQVILAGTLFYRTSQYEAVGRVASGMVPVEPYSAEDVEAIRRGESRHLVLQACSRGSLRLCTGDHAHHCTVFLIAGRKSGIRKALPDIFPGAKVQTWDRKTGEVLKSKVAYSDRAQQAITFIAERFYDDPHQALAASEVYKGIKVDRTNFPKLVAHPTFQTFMQDKGLVQIGLKGKRGKYFVARDRLAPGFHSEPSD